jgi:hypothetical protein
MKWCGFGVVTIHAGDGWLLNQFRGAKENNRKDRVGRQPREPLSLSVWLGQQGQPLTACCPNRHLFTSRQKKAQEMFINVYNYVAFSRGIW